MKYCISFVFVILLFSGLQAQTAVPADKAITEFDVNGLKVIVKRRPSSPTVSAGLFTRGGVKNTTVENAGIEALTLAVEVEGSKKFPRDVMRKELSRTGSSIGSEMNSDFGVISLASTLPHFDRTWEIFTDVVLDPAFTAEDFGLVRDRFLTGLRNQTVSPDSALDVLEEKVLFAGHPYAAEPMGSVESIGKLKLEDLKAYHRSLMQTSRLLLVIVGDLDPAIVQKRVEASFGKMARGNYKEPPTPQVAFSKPSVDITPRTLPTNYVKGVFAAPSFGSPDYYAMRVAMTILQSRVYQEVRTRRNLSYAPNAEMDDFAANTANISVTSTDANQSVAVMLREIEKMKQDDDPEYSEAIPGFFLTTYYLAEETNAAQVAELARYELIGGGWRNSLDFLNRIRSVKPDDIKAVAKKYMKNLRFFVVGDPRAIDRTIFTQSE